MCQETLLRGSSGKNVQLLQSHEVLRAIALAIGIITARHLFVNGFHYPSLMLLVHASIALLVESFCSSEDEEENTTRRTCPHSRTTRLYQAAFAVCLGLCIFFSYQSLLDSQNTTLWFMLIATNWFSPITRYVAWYSSQPLRRNYDAPLSVLTTLLCLLILVWKENWLVEKAVILNLLAAVFVATARHLWTSGRIESPVVIGRIHMDAYVAGLWFCQILNIMAVICQGSWYRRDFHVRGRIAWIIVNTIASVIALQSNAILRRLISLFQRKVTYTETKDTHAAFANHEFGSITLSLCVILLIEIDNCFAQHRPSTTSIAQWVVFFIAHLASIDVRLLAMPANQTDREQPHLPLPGLSPKTPNQYAQLAPNLDDAKAFNRKEDQRGTGNLLLRRIYTAWQAFLSSLTLLLVVYCAMGAAPREPDQSSWDLDIVIAWYNEPIETVMHTVQQVLAVPSTASRKVRTIVYHKGTENEKELEQAFLQAIGDNLSIRRLENLGREASTYLTHVLNQEDDWARHTLFIQAEAHHAAYLPTRLRDYFVHNTGFLSLSYTDSVCANCDECNDPTGWSNGTLVRDVFERANPDQVCRDISMTWRGQFVVSAQRMRAANQDLLKDLRDQVDASLDFGFPLERLYGIMFGCPTISERCPTILSGYLGNVGDVADCQCLDVEQDVRQI
ncbi:hypothetical protein F4808DRAFT_354966 [Astrocystis sublimbata]|nr:hypothetical protein F4808DRAFT_354966 [Astrocystis sublimbata]